MSYALCLPVNNNKGNAIACDESMSIKIEQHSSCLWIQRIRSRFELIDLL